MALNDLVWSIGGRIDRRLGDAIARALSYPLALAPLPALAAWERSVTRATGERPSRGRRRRLIENWLRNTLWSLSLAGWSDAEVLSVADITERDLARLRESIAGPGLILALPHMGSWDFAGAWCARVGIKVVSVAERLPGGLFEKFRDARAGMGMDIYPVDQPNLMRALADDIARGSVVCLLSDRDLSSRGIRAPWPGGGELAVPAGPALLARRTGADLRVVTTRFDGRKLRITVSEPLAEGDTGQMTASMVAEFATGIRRSPENWLMLRDAIS